MKALYFHCQSGASGDMIVGALLDLGISKDWFIEELVKLGLKDYQIEIKKVNKKGVKALRFIVHARKEKQERNPGDIYKIINQSFLSYEVKQLSKKIFLNLAEAEAKAHKTTIGKVHFHEVGAMDSIIDIVSAAILINKLKPQKIYASIAASSIIFPATKELLDCFPLTILRINKELITPTGVAIIQTLTDEFIDNDNIDVKVAKRGYGAGKMNLKIPNVLKVALGETKMEKNNQSIILETNIDDMNPEFYGHVIKLLIENGAREAFIQPIVMKKNRIGTLLTAICDEEVKDNLIELIFDETTTFGIRVDRISRICLDRKFKKIKTKYGLINIKIGEYKGKVRTISPEYDDCKRAAIMKKTPIKKVYDEAKQLAKIQKNFIII